MPGAVPVTHSAMLGSEASVLMAIACRSMAVGTFEFQLGGRAAEKGRRVKVFSFYSGRVIVPGVLC